MPALAPLAPTARTFIGYPSSGRPVPGVCPVCGGCVTTWAAGSRYRTLRERGRVVEPALQLVVAEPDRGCGAARQRLAKRFEVLVEPGGLTMHSSRASRSDSLVKWCGARAGMFTVIPAVTLARWSRNVTTTSPSRT